MAVADLIAKGYGGYKGWGDAEADADFKATGGSGKLTSGGSSGGGGVADYGAATSLLGQQKENNAAFLAGQNAQTSDYLNRYSNAIKGQETMSAMAKRLGTELNLPTLAENAYNINKTVREIPQTYNAATRGFDVNANQLSRIVGQKTSELAPALTTANEALANAQNNLTTMLGYAQTDQAKELLPFAAELTVMNDRLARETTMYTTQNQNELDTIIAKIKSGIDISEAEKNRANQLAQSELSYKAAMEKLNADTAQGQIETIGGNKYLVNMRTGEKKLLGSATSGTGTSANIGKYADKAATTPSATKDTGVIFDSIPAGTYNPFGFSSASNLNAYNQATKNINLNNLPSTVSLNLLGGGGNMGVNTPSSGLGLYSFKK